MLNARSLLASLLLLATLALGADLSLFQNSSEQKSVQRQASFRIDAEAVIVEAQAEVVPTRADADSADQRDGAALAFISRIEENSLGN